ncbi:acyltransferase family protein [Mucilaginibacter antarcticus]|uniref:acyltransferase family protein n=1 Tax=Mucilaginibacter antarcticus TaxID=1855725 RepID=UPI00363C2DEB
MGVVLYHLILPYLGFAFDRKYPLSALVLDYVFFIPNIFKHYYNPGSILIVLWSIGIEEQFYLFIPVFMFLFKRNVIQYISFLLLILLIILFLFPQFYVYQNFYFYFIFGGLLSSISLQKKRAIFKNKALHIVVYLLFIFSFLTNVFESENIFIYHVFNMLISGLFISLISDYPIFIVKNRFLDYLGKISYGVYVYHAIVFTGILFLVTKFKLYSYINPTLFIVLLNLLVIVITMLVAHLSFKFFESKFYRRK